MERLRPLRYGIYLMDQFPLMAVASAIEPLRAANLIARKTLYEIDFLSTTGQQVASSSRGYFDTSRAAEQGRKCDVVFIAAGGDPMLFDDAGAFAVLRALAVRGVPLGGFSGGPVVLARAGLMAGRRFTVHWEHVESLRELSEEFLLERRLFVIDRDRYTCAGGAGALDMMHALIARDHGSELATAVSDWLIHTGIRSAEEPQRSAGLNQAGLYRRSVATALQLMENHIAEPLSLPDIARLTGLSARQLQRQFIEDVGLTVARTFLNMRLEKADQLLRQTRLPIIDVALAAGFSNQTHFSRVYRRKFGQTPTERRKSALNQSELAG